MSNFIHKIIKIMYVEEGFLPDYPYHLISDEEMFEAFLNSSEDDYFHTMYPCVDESLKSEYQDLIDGLQLEIDNFLTYSATDGSTYNMPSWVYSYMTGQVTGPNSSQLDKHDLMCLLDCDNIDDEFTAECSSACYEASKNWLSKYLMMSKSSEDRPFTMFGEAHVWKYLRLRQADALRSEDGNEVS
jgi:hypothetical protein|nr:MAG TPA: hypothetical protein [Caudoviricetes sp.]